MDGMMMGKVVANVAFRNEKKEDETVALDLLKRIVLEDHGPDFKWYVSAVVENSRIVGYKAKAI